MTLFDELWDGEPIRLLGVRTTKLVSEDEPVQLSLFDMNAGECAGSADKGPDSEKQKNLEDALIKIRDRYGESAVMRGKVKRNDDISKE